MASTLHHFSAISASVIRCSPATYIVYLGNPDLTRVLALNYGADNRQMTASDDKRLFPASPFRDEQTAMTKIVNRNKPVLENAVSVRKQRAEEFLLATQTLFQICFSFAPAPASPSHRGADRARKGGPIA